jgi:alkylation response protein AidB-like acyl-CoA dehydrogenase
MDFSFDEDTEQFRAEAEEFFKEFLKEDHTDLHVDGSPANHRFRRAVADKGWLAASWPTEFGGQGRNTLNMLALADEAVFANVPLQDFTATMYVANVLAYMGTEEQQRNIVPELLSGDLRVCLGYSEPGSGSDVAAARTRAVRDGEDWLINGQKMFTSSADDSEYVFLLTRTNMTVPKRRGLTMFLVPLDSPGVEIQLLKTINGRRTCVTYYTDVRVSDSLRVGEVDEGWNVLNFALTFDHGGGTNTARSLSALGIRFLDQVVKSLETQESGSSESLLDEPTTRERIGRAAVSNEVARLLTLKTAWNANHNQEAAVDGPVAKLFSRETYQRAALDLLDLFGVEGTLDGGDDQAPGKGWLRFAMLTSIGGTIYGGSSEIQRNIIAERGLGLPRTRS